MRWSAVLDLVAWAGCSASPPPPTAPKIPPLRLSSGAPGGSFHSMGDTLARVSENEHGQHDILNVDTAGSVSNLEALQAGTTDCAFSYADVAYEAMAGRLPDSPPRAFDRLRGVAVVQLTPLYFLVARNSPIRTVSDLRGRTVALRSRESGSLQAAMLVLGAHGLDSRAIHIKSETFLGSFARLEDGSVDALFILTGQPSEPIARAVEAQATILPIAGDLIDRLRRQYPFLQPLLIPSGTYAGHKAPIRTIGMDSLLLCRADIDPQRVYDITRTWFHAAQSSADGSMSGVVGPSRASATSIPLHAGAGRYYRERQLQP
jgi:TRAP transporter TAXI family solute receptor